MLYNVFIYIYFITNVIINDYDSKIHEKDLRGGHNIVN